MSGLIGPKRHPGRFLSDKKQLKNPLVPVNLIHQVDCIGLIDAIITKAYFGETVNGCADEHPIREEFYKKAAKKLNLNQPTFSKSDTRSFKLVSNKKSKADLDYTYQFANPEAIFETDYHSGKVDIVGAGPGDIKLLTIQALECIQNSEIIKY